VPDQHFPYTPNADDPGFIDLFTEDATWTHANYSSASTDGSGPPQIEDPDSALSRGKVDLLILPRDFCAREHPLEMHHPETFCCLV